MAGSRPIVMVSSTVYYQQAFLDQVYAVLDTFGYTVWMSHSGTLPVHPRLSNFDNCERAAEACDVFVGIITGRYGSGRGRQGKSITHREMDRAIRCGKPTFFLVHHDVVVARQLLRQYKENPRRLVWKFPFKPTPVLDDLRVLQMYEKAMRQDAPLGVRKGNWVQEYNSPPEALRYIDAQLADSNRLTALLNTGPSGGKP